MEPLTDLFPGQEYKTRVWVTAEGRKELESVHPEVFDLFENQAERGFKGYKGWLRWEGDGIWAYGTDGETDRICGYFLDESTRANFVVCGMWKGKQGKGNSRPHAAEAVVKRAVNLKAEGLKGVSFPKETKFREAQSGPQDGKEARVLRHGPSPRSG